MKFAEKCPKCGGFVQTKSIRKTIGFGSVEIPVAQFCLNPVCDWYQDFAEARKPEDIKEGYHLKAPSLEGKLPRFNMPVLSRNFMIGLLGSVIVIVILYIMMSFLPPVSNTIDEKIPKAVLSELSNNTFTNITNTPNAARQQETPKVTAALPTPEITGVKIEPSTYTVKIDVGHGFFPDNMTINTSDTIIWDNEENVRPRVILVSSDELFEKQLLHYTGRYHYQFNKSGKYTFFLAEYGTYKEYLNATGSVIVK